MQILNVTCDKVTANDVMIDHLATILEEFPGFPNQTCCFAHILNLVAKCVMRQFDTPNLRRMRNAANNNIAAVFGALANDLEESNQESDSKDEGDDNAMTEVDEDDSNSDDVVLADEHVKIRQRD